MVRPIGKTSCFCSIQQASPPFKAQNSGEVTPWWKLFVRALGAVGFRADCPITSQLGQGPCDGRKADLRAVLNWATGITCAYQRRAAKVNEPLVAERMVGNAVFGSRGCDRYSAINVTT
jgi:hypothetical protein